jgi:hypothetical protein
VILKAPRPTIWLRRGLARKPDSKYDAQDADAPTFSALPLASRRVARRCPLHLPLEGDQAKEYSLSYALPEIEESCNRIILPPQLEPSAGAKKTSTVRSSSME